ncbi:MAG: hypothetical protein K0S39_2546 [Paenibacillus sp.]|nr:hypothetical protein [Paenibacillus sp.]
MMSKEQHVTALWLSLLGVNRQLKQSLQVMNTDDQLSLSTISVIHQLEQQSMKMNDIADFIGITLGAATSLVDKLEQLKLVDRVRSLEDRRIVYVHLTDAGKERLQSIRSHFIQEANVIFKELPDDKVQELGNQLRTIGDCLIQYNQRKHQSK